MLENEVYISVATGRNNALELDDVGMAELTKEHDLAVGALCVSRVAKCIKIFLESLDCAGVTVDNLPHVSIGTTAYLLGHLVQLQYMPFNFLTHFIITATQLIAIDANTHAAIVSGKPC